VNKIGEVNKKCMLRLSKFTSILENSIRKTVDLDQSESLSWWKNGAYGPLDTFKIYIRPANNYIISLQNKYGNK